MRKIRLRLPMASALQMVDEKDKYIQMLREDGFNIVDIQYEPSVVHSVILCFNEEGNGYIEEF